jgi:hypothetical protein
MSETTNEQKVSAPSAAARRMHRYRWRQQQGLRCLLIDLTLRQSGYTSIAVSPSTRALWSQIHRSVAQPPGSPHVQSGHLQRNHRLWYEWRRTESNWFCTEMPRGNPHPDTRNLRPWRKGQSGNPKGSSKKQREKGDERRSMEEIRALAQTYSEEALLKAVEIMRTAENPRVALAASRDVHERAYGAIPRAPEPNEPNKLSFLQLIQMTVDMKSKGPPPGLGPIARPKLIDGKLTPVYEDE